MRHNQAMRLGLALLLLVAPAVAVAEPLTMTAATHGSFLELTFTNTSKKPLEMTTHVYAGLDHYDWLAVTLSGKTKRTLHFTEARTKAIPKNATIAPGKSITKRVDLVLWSIHGDNGDPLAPDTYDVEATWDTTAQQAGPKLKLAAKTKLVLAAPVEKGCTERAPAKTGLVLLARQVPKTSTIEVGLHNVDTVEHCVAGHIATHELQSDWLSVTVPEKTASRTIVFDDARDKSARVTVALAPGATVWTRWDVVAWAKRARNGGKAPSRWNTSATATYDASREPDVWRGAIKTSFGLQLP